MILSGTSAKHGTADEAAQARLRPPVNVVLAPQPHFCWTRGPHAHNDLVPTLGRPTGSATSDSIADPIRIPGRRVNAIYMDRADYHRAYTVAAPLHASLYAMKVFKDLWLLRLHGKLRLFPYQSVWTRHGDEYFGWQTRQAYNTAVRITKLDRNFAHNFAVSSSLEWLRALESNGPILTESREFSNAVSTARDDAHLAEARRQDPFL